MSPRILLIAETCNPEGTSVPLVGWLQENALAEMDYLIQLGNPGEIIASLRSELGRLCENPAEIDEKSPRALQRARQQFTWDTQARRIKDIYHWVTGQSDKPYFPMAIPSPIQKDRISPSGPSMPAGTAIADGKLIAS